MSQAMPQALLPAVRQTIHRYGMILPGERVAVACSGGPDSTALLLILRELADELGCTLAVCHFNHRLRGEESEQDEQFVRQLAERCDLPCQVQQADVRHCATSRRANLEDTARTLRYEFFRSLTDSGAAGRIAVGHTADDQAETVLHRLLRGAGGRGLAGIHPVVGKRIIRPLIELRRQALIEWLDRKSTRLNSSHIQKSRMPSSA